MRVLTLEMLALALNNKPLRTRILIERLFPSLGITAIVCIYYTYFCKGDEMF